MTIFAQSQLEARNVTLPLPPPLPEKENSCRMEHEIYARFMSFLRHAASGNIEIKILTSIQSTANALDYSEALVSKILVDLGLRAPQRAFPHAYLSHVERSRQRSFWQQGSATAPVKDLCHFWADPDHAPFRGYNPDGPGARPHSRPTDWTGVIGSSRPVPDRYQAHQESRH